MTRPIGKAVPATRADGARRLQAAEEFLAAVQESLAAHRRFAAAASATDAGIAAADAISILRVGGYFKGGDHRRAADHLRGADPDAAKLLARLLGLKDQAYYGTALISADRAARACVQAERLVSRARAAYEA